MWWGGERATLYTLDRKFDGAQKAKGGTFWDPIPSGNQTTRTQACTNETRSIFETVPNHKNREKTCVTVSRGDKVHKDASIHPHSHKVRKHLRLMMFGVSAMLDPYFSLPSPYYTPLFAPKGERRKPIQIIQHQPLLLFLVSTHPRAHKITNALRAFKHVKEQMILLLIRGEGQL